MVRTFIFTAMSSFKLMYDEEATQADNHINNHEPPVQQSAAQYARRHDFGHDHSTSLSKHNDRKSSTEMFAR
jgi:hypothetical protein